ncbi:PTS mannose transporter subunit IID [Ligilactobacillus pobuzihii]|uniref:PTS system mannose/fructose/sorbose family transporter subunit IID n=1 Tax=Ligilactobacillus pobuzihii TaxID=449659 RepID=UPI0019D0F4C5|nr:mannose/fructose/sorbose PTS transporter subunit IID [Ligilactobacillus pobuzihii]MBN7274165.1 PTS mannose transporter subunit IID [Ligilactobacillus pobuzihii]
MVEENKKHLKKITKKDLFWTFIFENFQQASFNFETIHGLAFCVDMIPTIKRVYKDKKDQGEALKRHMTFFNVTPGLCGPVVGLTMAMEEARASGEDVDEGTIQSLKVGLMGPLAGVGDPVMWGTLRPILAALGASLALSGSWLGPILFFVAFNGFRLALKWFGMTLGYNRGIALVKDISGSLLPKLTEGATVLGLFVMGVLIPKWTTINIPLVISKTTVNGKTTVTTLQNILDQLCPSLPALGLTLLMMYLLKKKINPIILIFGLFGIGILGYWLGFLK